MSFRPRAGRFGPALAPVRLAAIVVWLAAASFLTVTPAGAAVRSVAVPAAAHQAELSAVACPRSDLCIAVGYRATAHGPQPVAEEWRGGSWKAMVIPASSSGSADLDAVSCPSRNDCTAVGSEARSPADSGPFAEQWNGHHWRITLEGNPHGVKGGFLAGVSCASARDCVAVGFWQATSRFEALSEKWSGSWKVLKAASVSGSVQLAGVSCHRRFCLAAGVRYASPAVPIAEKLTGSTWTLESTPSVSGSNFAEFLGVTCVGSSFCLGVGQSQGNSDFALAEQWTGSWSRLSISATNDILFGVACAGQDHCMAVGTDAAGKPVSEHWTGSWTSVPTAAHLSGAQFDSLVSVACPDATRCLAVGARASGAPGATGTTLAEEWSGGSTWKVQTTANP